jgi:hypothetical protein
MICSFENEENKSSTILFLHGKKRKKENKKEKEEKNPGICSFETNYSFKLKKKPIKRKDL